MSHPRRTFSESWHRVADIRVSLLTTVKSHKQFFRGDWWYVLNDPYNNRFFRVPLYAYEFIAKLNYEQSVGQIWQTCLELDPQSTPGQEEVIQLLTQLHQNNLLHYDSSTDNAVLYQRQEKLRRKQMRAKLMGFMFMRIPLFDPDKFIRFILPALKPFFSVFGALLWIFVILAAGKVLIENFSNFTAQSSQVFSGENLLLLYLGMAFIKSLHELGHTIVCRYYGGEVRTLGVMLILFTPLPYMDATSSWSFRQRWQRAFVGAAGMIVEIFIAAIAVFVWANTGQGVVNSLAYNMIFVASVSTLLFNANPLLRFDGYYILSDLLDIPNLYQRSRSQLTFLIERYIYQCKNVTTHAYSLKESYQLAIYAILSIIYRIVVFVGIILFVADQYLILGLIMAVVSSILWLVLPPLKIFKYLASNNRIARRRKQAIVITSAFFVGLMLLLSLVPMPDRFRINGVIEAKNSRHLYTKVDGFVDRILVAPGTSVSRGTALIQLRNKQLSYRYALVLLQRKEVVHKIAKARKENSVELATLEKQYKNITQRIQKLSLRINNLTIKATVEGIWSAPDANERRNQWLFKGSQIGTILSDDDYRFSATVLQDDNSSLFQQGNKEIEIRIRGQQQHNLISNTIEVIPFQHEKRTSATGGQTGAADSNGQAAEPFFRVYASLPVVSPVPYVHGVSGVMRISLEPKPLLLQWSRRIRQLIQKRYQL
ncbi:MAG: hypothetical protein OFPI_40940 [Osedax symbiont Rs2]|nr:MAG: hypothetical protein OFPI_40940 [Osedax symbiont Rs2]